MGIFGALLVLALFLYVMGLIALCIYYEVRRARRIRLGLPLEDTKAQPRGFDVLMPGADAASMPPSSTLTRPNPR